MSQRSRISSRRHCGIGRVTDVRFMEVEFDAPPSARHTRLIVEVEGGLRLLVADDASVELAAQLLNALGRLCSSHAPRKARAPQAKRSGEGADDRAGNRCTQNLRGSRGAGFAQKFSGAHGTCIATSCSGTSSASTCSTARLRSTITL
jgi:hypothetical protein